MDQTTIQDAFTRLGPRGGIVRLEPADYTIRQNLNIPDNIVLCGAGVATQLILQQGVSVVVPGKGNVRIRDLLINADAHVVNNRALVIANPSDVIVENCWVLNCGGFGIFVTGNNNAETGKIRIMQCRLSGKGNNDVIGGGPMTAASTLSEIIISDNFIRQDNTTGRYRNAIDIVAMTRTIVTRNIVEGSIVMGGEKLPHARVDISHNIVSPAINASFCQIALLTQSDVGEADVSHSIRIIGNDISGGQIYLQGQKSTQSRTAWALIQSNIVRSMKNHADPSVNRGIIVSHMQDVIIDGNIVEGAGSAIVSGDVLNLRLSGNHLTNYTTALTTDSLTTLAV